MKPSALLVNTHAAGLIEAGRSPMRSRAVGPDLRRSTSSTRNRCQSGDPLVARENALCTPHLGYVTRESYELYFGQAFDQINAFAAGDPPGIVNPERWRGARRLWRLSARGPNFGSDAEV